MSEPASDPRRPGLRSPGVATPLPQLLPPPPTLTRVCGIEITKDPKKLLALARIRSWGSWANLRARQRGMYGSSHCGRPIAGTAPHLQQPPRSHVVPVVAPPLLSPYPAAGSGSREGRGEVARKPPTLPNSPKSSTPTPAASATAQPQSLRLQLRGAGTGSGWGG